MLTVETTDVDPEGNESIWFGGKVIIGDSFLHFDLGLQKIVYCKSSILQLCRSYDLAIHHLPSLRLFCLISSAMQKEFCHCCRCSNWRASSIKRLLSNKRYPSPPPITITRKILEISKKEQIRSIYSLSYLITRICAVSFEGSVTWNKDRLRIDLRYVQAGATTPNIVESFGRTVNCNLFTHGALGRFWELVETRPCVPDRSRIWKCWFLRRAAHWLTQRKTSRSKWEKQQQAQTTYGIDGGSNPRPRWWQASAITTASPLFPSIIRFFPTKLTHS